ncbi:glycosyltransferase involved in cell wall biosynthesis [Saccharothrix tamanrassetensis]|uniref:Glycosyltransferase involved in cell wall biosynthesis n=1 Tax=Saccharothrix tamanrassetensis TaxID=1051531 RepID=A0A841CBP7_9PSEU|nr:glycosyltransferase family 4 protein [Saccharothrix tamanrassetensis]MBB5953597.1 glycosyltransferase involved in cell wall biosynthesis [Saccharothrix tamanrassetensis]
MTGYFVVPGGVHDPGAPSGGNVYDRRVSQGLDVVAVAGSWPRPAPEARALLHRVLAGFEDGAVVLIDGLVACGVPDVVVPHTGRLRIAVLVHLPLADETGVDPAVAAELDVAERACLRAVDAVVATSPEAAKRLTRHHGLKHVHVVAPGTDPAPPAPGTDGMSGLLCVASVTPRKGHDVLVEALARVADVPWHCVCVGPVPPSAHVTRLRELIARHGLGDRVRLVGPLNGEPLERAYAAADLFVLPSRAETYGMVVTEALARGIPVVASAVPDALGDGGLLLPPGDVDALSDALRQWFHSEDRRRRLRDAAARRRPELSTWDETVRGLDRVLASLRP